MKRVVFPGTFDPVTLGHYDLVMRALTLFDEVIIAAGNNSEKKTFFSLERRLVGLKNVFSGQKRVRIESYAGLTVDFCKSMEAKFILRGLRAVPDFEFERVIAQMNQSMEPEIETVFLMTRPEYSAISSSIVRDIFKNGGDVTAFLPKGLKLESLSN